MKGIGRLAHAICQGLSGCQVSDARFGFVSIPGVSDISSGWLLDPPL